MTALWFETALLRDGWARDVRLTVEDGGIAAVEVGASPQAGDLRGGAAIPGMANLHSHAFQRAMAGLAEARSPAGEDFWSWREVMYRFVERLTPDDVEAIAAQAYAEMLEAGFTRVGEFHYLHNAPEGAPYADPAEMAWRIAAAASATGLGLTLLPVFYAHGGFGGQPLGPRQRRFELNVDRFAELVAATRAKGVETGVAPHSLRAVTPDELAAILPLAPQGPVHIHVAEQRAEVDGCLAWSGARPVQWLLDHAEIDRRWCLVHATHMDMAETARLAASGAVAGLCPITEANLGDGLFPARAFLDAGGAFGVGGDSNVRIDLSEELRLFEYGQRLAGRARGVVGSGAELFKGALTGGAQALGQGAPAIAAGEVADIVELDADHPSLAGRSGDALLDGWVFSAGQAAVRRVWTGGVLQVDGGRHVRGEAIAARYRRTLRDVLAR
jgi:formimidoylglutamate deiminase